MNFEQAIHVITKRGFTARQAQFLILIARHSGVCVMRQYSTFAGIVFGQKTRKFFDRLVRSGFVATYDCAHGRGRVFHVRHRAIYEAIGEPDSRLLVAASQQVKIPVAKRGNGSVVRMPRRGRGPV